MRDQVIRGCRRTEAEQRYIRSALEIFSRLGESRRREIRGLVEKLTDGPAEARALFSVLVRGTTMQRACESTGVPLRRLTALRREFFDQIPIE